MTVTKFLTCGFTQMGISRARLNRYALLRHKKHREKEGLFLVQGEKAVKDTLGKFDIETILCIRPDKHSFLQGIKEIQEVSEGEMRKISTLEKLPEITAVYRIPKIQPSLQSEDIKEFSLVLDGIQDPGNLGTIIRTAHWFGIRKIFCSLDTVDIYNAKVVMATMGSIASVETIYCDLNELFALNPNVPAYGLLLEGENLFAVKDLKPGFIIMGSEGHGPSDETRRHITRGLTIPAADPDDSPDSLNVAIATAITLSQILK